MREEIFATLPDFTCKLYATRTTISHANELQYHLWRAKKEEYNQASFHPARIAYVNMRYRQTTRVVFGDAVWSPVVMFPVSIIMVGSRF